MLTSAVPIQIGINGLKINFMNMQGTEKKDMSKFSMTSFLKKK